MLSCKEITRILSSDEELRLIKRTELRMHLLMCEHCSNYNKHLKQMKEGFKKFFKKKYEVKPDELTKLEESIIKKHTR
ncbi:MAG: hypothetical protein COW01_03740 [Bdellovibrionales bacterium CG12_big_fil_rev_8_21_14_0_65_38_15]|nr:MAG: hypothetical protein COW79_02605 [Bdellovibrionales bacterium CG22_combo_CG10-13_8_21_14_all_38_13]PIQ56728.1 MAG: hypothetical protein COW01_03740 [Bdellovibrionales bacterium CG12_big_fil_rev_8_21_14_0_65_38_15]PIR31044.1 MAG: hypothetical protein COV38_02560 [Bdellovibrionales bacterium CG11_big_fil_rev_8_21_14_0_20_38_13]